MKNILRGEWQFKGLSSSDMVVTGEFFTVEDAVLTVREDCTAESGTPDRNSP